MALLTPPVEDTAQLPRIGDRDRRRASARFERPSPGRYLAIEDGEEVILIALEAPVLHLGRSQSANVVLENKAVSRRHAIVARRGTKTVILDDRSANGVLVNGTRVAEAVLEDGDVVQLGEVVMRFLDVPGD